MDWKTFIASVIGSLAWPVVVAFLIISFRDKLKELLPRLRKLNLKDAALEFSDAVRELEREASPGDTTTRFRLATPNGQLQPQRQQFDFLMKLAEVSPRSAVQESFRILETSAAKAAVKAHPNLDRQLFNSPQQIFRSLKSVVLQPQEFRQLEELRRLRNVAAHSEDFDLQGHPIEAYIDIALSLARRLDEYAP